MIQTEVKQLTDHEHQIDVRLPKSEYTRVYDENLKKLMAKKYNIPGFRPGKVPRHVIISKFSGNLHQDTVSTLVEAHYNAALQESGLEPAVQPTIDMPESQPDEEFLFNLLVTTWPKLELSSLSEMEVEILQVTVFDDDVDGVIERLKESQFHYSAADKSAENGDKVCMDYVGYLGDEVFEGGQADDAELVIGSNAYILGFEEQLLGTTAGQHVTVSVQFPVPYQNEALAGQHARFEVDVKTVMQGKPCASIDDLAVLLGFENEEALRNDAQSSLQREAEKATLEKTRNSVMSVLVENNPVEVPAKILQEYVRQGLQRFKEKQSKEGGKNLSAEEEQRFVLYANEIEQQKLKTTMIFFAIQDVAGIEVTDEDVQLELDQLSLQHPENQRKQYIQWMKGTKENLEDIQSSVIERKSIDYVLSQAKVTKVVKSITELQQEIDADQATEEEALSH